MKVITLYDFDKTIYDGDSTVDFYLYCLRRKPTLLRYLPGQLWHGLLFITRTEEKTVFKGNFFSFLRGIDGLEEYVESFWATNEKKIGQWYKEREHSRDVIISASPEFLVVPVVSKLGANKIIATRVDPHSGVIYGKNCYGVEKVRRLLKEFKNSKVDETYSDSFSDMPIFDLAERKYIVKRHKIVTLEYYQRLSWLQRIFL